MSSPLPLLIVSDAPGLGTGLGRIARDLASRMHEHSAELGVRVAQLGMYHDGDTEWPWPVWRMHDEKGYGAEDVARAWWRFAGEKPGVVLTIWDPARAIGVVEAAKLLPVRLWGYFPIDGVNVHGSQGVADKVIKDYDRVLGYGQWGAEVLAKATGREKVQWLPHGIDAGVWRPRRTQISMDGELPIVREYVGAVMANQPRKDFGTLFQAWQQIAEEQAETKFWLHTDLSVKHWSVPQLAEDFGLNNERLTVTHQLTDEQLAEWYSACWVTMLPSPEGFGYPIVESMACGTPVVGYAGAGGAELLPRPAWRVAAKAHRLESCYNIVRPVFEPAWWARAAMWAMDWRQRDRAAEAYCTGAVAHLDWQVLFGRWASWVRQGVREIKA